MYLKFYGLRQEPFGVTPDPQFLYASPTYQEALATLEYGVRSGRGFTALIAKPGMGKTTLLFHLLERYSRQARTAFIFLTQCDSREFMRYLMSELGADSGETDFVRLQEQFGQLLVREAQSGRKVIAVVDEAQNLDVSVLETVRLLSDFETPQAKLLHIILTGQPELAERLASPALLQLRQRISHLVRLEPLSAAEVNRYIDHRLQVAGYGGGPLFTPEARNLIVQRSEGIPRTVNNLCFNALSLGCALQRRNIGADVVAEVSADLDFEGLRTQQEEAAEAAGLQTAAAPSGQAPAPLREPLPFTAGAPVAAAGGVEEVQLPTAAGKDAGGQETTPAEAPPGPVLVPDPGPPAAARDSEQVASAEVGNLALRIVPAETAGDASAPVPMNGCGPAPLTVPGAPGEPGSAPANGSGAANPADKAKASVDVEALAADCALLGMEASRRWKQMAGRLPSRPTPLLRASAPMTAGAPNAGPAAVTPLPAAGTAAPAPVNGSAKIPLARPGQPAGGGLPRAVPGKVRPARPAAAAPNGRMRRRRRSLYLAAGASLLLLLILIWLLGASGPSTASQSKATPPAQNASEATDSSAGDGGQATPTDSSVLDVVEELPRPGAAGGESRPAVVMRGTRSGEELLRRVDPVYPAAAQAARIQGPVVLDATIGTHGFLRHIRVVSGPPLLADSVLDAVRGWRYRPRTVRGRAVERETRIVVNFQLVNPGNSQRNP